MELSVRNIYSEFNLIDDEEDLKMKETFDLLKDMGLYRQDIE